MTDVKNSGNKGPAMSSDMHPLRTPSTAKLAAEKIAEIEAIHGVARRVDGKPYLGDVAIVDIAQPERSIYSDIEALRSLADWAGGGRSRLFFVLEQGAALLGKSMRN